MRQSTKYDSETLSSDSESASYGHELPDVSMQPSPVERYLKTAMPRLISRVEYDHGTGWLEPLIAETNLGWDELFEEVLTRVIVLSDLFTGVL